MHIRNHAVLLAIWKLHARDASTSSFHTKGMEMKWYCDKWWLIPLSDVIARAMCCTLQPVCCVYWIKCLPYQMRLFIWTATGYRIIVRWKLTPLWLMRSTLTSESLAFSNRMFDAIPTLVHIICMFLCLCVARLLCL